MLLTDNDTYQLYLRYCPGSGPNYHDIYRVNHWGQLLVLYRDGKWRASEYINLDILRQNFRTRPLTTLKELQDLADQYRAAARQAVWQVCPAEFRTEFQFWLLQHYPEETYAVI